jgi:hypothetical protein
MMLMTLTVSTGLMPIVLAGSLVMLPRAVGMLRELSYHAQEGRSQLHGFWWSVPVLLLFVMAGGMLYTSTLGYRGLFMSPALPELGNMLANSRQYMNLDVPWITYWPAITLLLLLLAWVMAGETLLERLGFRSKAVWSKVLE